MLSWMIGITAFVLLIVAGGLLALRKSGLRWKDKFIVSSGLVVLVFAYIGYKTLTDCFPCGTYKSEGDIFLLEPNVRDSLTVTFKSYCEIPAPTSKNPRRTYGKAFEVQGYVSTIGDNAFEVSVPISNLPECAPQRVHDGLSNTWSFVRTDYDPKKFHTSAWRTFGPDRRIWSRDRR
jgi:hypothetical protein